MDTAYEKLQRKIAETPEQPTLIISSVHDAEGRMLRDSEGNIALEARLVPPLSQDDSEYGRAMRKLRDDLEVYRLSGGSLAQIELDSDIEP